MMNSFCRCWDGRPRQNELPFLTAMVYLKSDGIPNLWDYLPLINQSWILPFEEHFYPKICHLQIVVLIIWVSHIQYALSLLFCRGSLSTPFRTFNKHSPDFFKSVFQ